MSEQIPIRDKFEILRARVESIEDWASLARDSFEEACGDPLIHEDVINALHEVLRRVQAATEVSGFLASDVEEFGGRTDRGRYVFGVQGKFTDLFVILSSEDGLFETSHEEATEMFRAMFESVGEVEF